jgi:energy-coupling factor transport system ATP-binding protein
VSALGDPPAILFDRVSVTYPDQAEPVLRGVELEVAEGELCLVVGATGSGKSTLLAAVNGLVPHFSGGLLQGRVMVAGRDTAAHHPRDLAELVGVVGQDPLAGFVTDTVEEELAYAMEQLGVAPEVMRKRVEETLDLLGIADLRNRALRDLSGGQQQRVAIGAALTAQPRVLVLDEPTSALDPTAAEEVLAAVTRLVHDLGVTVVMAEHRLERVVQYADRVVQVLADRTVRVGEPAEVMADCPVAPPVVRLGRLAGWSPVPLSVRDARRRAPELRARLEAAAPDGGGDGGGTRDGRGRGAGKVPPTLSAREVTVCHGPVVAVRGLSVDLHPGQVVALMGRNGSGKSSLLWALQGTGARQGGRVEVGARDPGDLRAAEARRLVGLVPQSPTDLLYLVRVLDECRRADHDADAPEGTCRALLDTLVDGVADEANPRDLSEGQRLAVALAVQLSAAPPVVLLDEPTRGLDYGAKERLGSVVRNLAVAGRAVVVATHDVEFAAEWADRVLVMAEGELVADGPTAEVVVASASLAPQVAKVLHPEPWLTVEQVAAALGLGGPSPALDLRDGQGARR